MDHVYEKTLSVCVPSTSSPSQLHVWWNPLGPSSNRATCLWWVSSLLYACCVWALGLKECTNQSLPEFNIWNYNKWQLESLTAIDCFYLCARIYGKWLWEIERSIQSTRFLPLVTSVCRDDPKKIFLVFWYTTCYINLVTHTFIHRSYN